MDMHTRTIRTQLNHTRKYHHVHHLQQSSTIALSTVNSQHISYQHKLLEFLIKFVFFFGASHASNQFTSSIFCNIIFIRVIVIVVSILFITFRSCVCISVFRACFSGCSIRRTRIASSRLVFIIIVSIVLVVIYEIFF